MRAYSLDLRERVVRAVRERGQTPAAAAPKVVEVEKLKDNLFMLKGGGGNTAGRARVVWNTRQFSVISFTTSGHANVVTITGKVTSGTAFVGDKSSGTLVFNADATKCLSSGATSATFSGTGSLS